MAVPLNVSPELGRMVRQARQARGWTIDELSVELGRFGTAPDDYVLGRTQLTRLEQGQRNVSSEEAWRLVEMFDELDAWELLAAGRAVDPDSSLAFQRAIAREAERRRAAYRSGGGGRRGLSERLATRRMTAAGRVAMQQRGHDFAATPLSTDQHDSTMGTWTVFAPKRRARAA